MDKENQGMNLDGDFVADLGVPFICPNCNELFGSQEYLSQHSEICRGLKSDFDAATNHRSRELGGQNTDGHFASSSAPVPFPASLRSFNFHRSLIPSTGSKHHQSTIQRNYHSSPTPPYPSFPLDPSVTSAAVFHLPMSHSAEAVSHHSVQRNDVLLSSTTERKQAPEWPFQMLPAMSLNLNGAGNGSGPVPCPGCHDIYINSWFLSHHLKCCPKLLTPSDKHGTLGNASDFEQSRNYSCPGTSPKFPSSNVPAQDLNATNADPCHRDPPLQTSVEDEPSSGQSETSSLNVECSTDSVMHLVSSPDSYSTVSAGEMKIDDVSGIHVCQACGKSFTNKSNLKAHVRTHTGERPFACEECGQKFSHKSNLKKHYTVHTQEKPFDCPLCCASFAQKSGLKLHWRTHTGERPFECHECGQRFSSNSNLKKHVMIHTGEKPFCCKVCGRRYSTDEALQAHAATHTGNRNFICPMCDVAFTHRGGLEAHIRTHTGEKPFSCNYCELTFARRGGLKAHMRTHTGEKPYPCTDCGLAFAHKSNLNAHYRTHSGEKPFGCPHCNQKFAHKSNLKKHVTTHSGSRSFTSSPAGSSSDSSCTLNDISSAPVISAVTKVTSVSPFSENCDAKFMDLLDMFEHSSTQALLET